MLRTVPLWPVCGICHEPVKIETSKTDEAGRAVHEECYLLKVKLHRATSSQIVNDVPTRLSDSRPRE